MYISVIKCGRRAAVGSLLLALAALVMAATASWSGPLLAGQWWPGDMHSHISPPDTPPNYQHAKNDLEGAVAAARAAGLKWLVITPHAMNRSDPVTGKLWATEMAERLAKRQAKPDDPLVVLGWEHTLSFPGHMTVSFVELSSQLMTLPLERLVRRVVEQGGLVIAAHPYSLPNFLDKANRSWRPWTAPPRGQELDQLLSGLEIFHPTSPALTAARQWDELIATSHRRLIGVGATDDHWGVLYATTWVYVDGDLTKEKLREALKGGRIVVGSDASAGSLTVASDLKDAAGKAIVGQVGDAVKAEKSVTVNWTGAGRLMVDGQPHLSTTGPVTLGIAPGSFHWYRLESGLKSLSNPIYVNLPPKPLAPPAGPAKPPTTPTKERPAATAAPAGKAPPATSAGKAPPATPAIPPPLEGQAEED